MAGESPCAAKPMSRGWLMPAEVKQFGKSRALEQVARGSGDSGLKLCPQVGGRLDIPVDLFLGHDPNRGTGRSAICIWLKMWTIEPYDGKLRAWNAIPAFQKSIKVARAISD